MAAVSLNAQHLVQPNGTFQINTGAANGAPVTTDSLHNNLGQFAAVILDAQREISAALNNPNMMEQPDLKLASNKRLVEEAKTALNLSFRALTGHLPPVILDQVNLNGNAGSGGVHMLYGLFLLNRINDAMTKIQSEIDALNAAMKNLSGRDKANAETAIKDLERAHKELAAIHGKLHAAHQAGKFAEQPAA
jgi:hypothetical protein